MKTIASFTVDHTKLLPGVYVSRKDTAGDTVVTTFDIRMTAPIEHLGATFLRNHAEWADKILYFGPMGCRTGFYLLLAGDHTSLEILPLMRECFAFIADYTGEIPGAAPEQCGNYLDQNLPMAKFLAGKFYENVLMKFSEEHYTYTNL